jgi:hypothetical protein
LDLKDIRREVRDIPACPLSNEIELGNGRVGGKRWEGDTQLRGGQPAPMTEISQVTKGVKSKSRQGDADVMRAVEVRKRVLRRTGRVTAR